MKTETTSIGLRVTNTEMQAIENEIEKGKAMNTSDFLRQAIREKLATATVA